VNAHVARRETESKTAFTNINKGVRGRRAKKMTHLEAHALLDESKLHFGEQLQRGERGRGGGTKGAEGGREIECVECPVRTARTCVWVQRTLAATVTEFNAHSEGKYQSKSYTCQHIHSLTHIHTYSHTHIHTYTHIHT
jgi:hypothetical protein